MNHVFKDNQKVEIDEMFLYYKKGLLELEKKEVSNAINYFSLALSLNDNQYEVYLMRGIAYKEKTMYCEAIADLDRAIELNPISHEAYSYRGLTNYLMHEQQNAIMDLSTSIILNPSDDFAAKLLDEIAPNSTKR